MNHDYEQESMCRIEEQLSKHKEPSASIANKFLQEENAKLREELAEAIERADKQFRQNGSLLRDNELLEQRAEAAEAKLKAASEQEPVAYHDYDEEGGLHLVERNDAICNWKLHEAHGWKLKPLYANPPVPADVQELQRELAAMQTLYEEQVRRRAELERKLAEQQVSILECGGTCGCGTDALSDYVAQAREGGRKEAIPEGWQVVPKEPTGFMHRKGTEYRSPTLVYRAMLAAAPKPEVKP